MLTSQDGDLLHLLQGDEQKKPEAFEWSLQEAPHEPIRRVAGGAVLYTATLEESTHPPATIGAVA